MWWFFFLLFSIIIHVNVNFRLCQWIDAGNDQCETLRSIKWMIFLLPQSQTLTKIWKIIISFPAMSAGSTSIDVSVSLKHTHTLMSLFFYCVYPNWINSCVYKIKTEHWTMFTCSYISTYISTVHLQLQRMPFIVKTMYGRTFRFFFQAVVRSNERIPCLQDIWILR